MSTFPLNAWYVACAAKEIDGDKPLGRKICNQSVVVYRGPEGQAAAVDNFCPHRGAALSLGKVVEGRLICGYHGLEVGCDGKTIAMPGQRVRGFPAIRSFPVTERYGFIWLWPGDPALADPAKIHRLDWADDPNWVYAGGLFHIKADYRLMIDNLMDLTHETYVHATSIGQKEIDEAPVKTEVRGDEVVTSRFMERVYAPPMWRTALRGNNLPDDGLVDRWQICRFSPPSHVMIEVGVALEGKGGYHADPSVRAGSTVVDFITPETETTMWYFWGMARNFNVADEALTERIRQIQSEVFTEDLEVLERQQENLGEQPDRKLLMLDIDAGGVQSRRVIARLIQAEIAEQAGARHQESRER